MKLRLLPLLMIFASVFSGFIAAEAAEVSSPDSEEVSLPVTSVYSLEIGSVSILDTYLSPLVYKGTSVTASGRWQKAFTRDPRKWTMQFAADVQYAGALNPAKLASEYLFNAGFNWSASRRWQLPYGVQSAIGPAVGFDAGVIYLPKNGNNPASAKCSFDLSLQASLSRVFRFGRLPVVVSDRVMLPALSAFFSPQFGEPYYEIYLGNHSGLAHCGWWGNHFCIDNLLAADLDFGKTALRIGYRFNARTSYVDDLNTKIFTHSFVIGVIPHGLGLKRGAPSEKNITIYAIY